MRILLILFVLGWTLIYSTPDPCTEQLRNISSEGKTCRDAVRTRDKLAQKQSPPLSWFLKTYVSVDLTTALQRRSWILKAKTLSQGSGYLFLDIELAMLRDLNKVIGDKNLVTASSNKYKEILETTLRLVLYQWRLNDETTLYSDYKSYRAAMPIQHLTKSQSRQLEKDLGLAFESANHLFSSYMIQSGFLDKKHNPKDWFRGGVGSTADEANFAARLSREISGRNQLRNFSNSTIQEHMRVATATAEIMRNELLTEMKDYNIFDHSQGVPRLEIWELLRRVEGAAELREAILLKLSGEQTKINSDWSKKLKLSSVEKLQTYKILVDTFSPPLRNEDRSIATLENADFGGMSADFAGLGAKNLMATAQAIRQSKELDALFINVRRAEEQVTTEFKESLARFESVIKNYFENSTTSGDDFVAYGNRELESEKKYELLNRVARETRDSKKRLAFIKSGVPRNYRNLIAAHGEMIEKDIRLNLDGKIQESVLSEIVFALDMKVTAPGQGGVYLLMGFAQPIRLTNLQMKLIQSAFKQATEKLNQEFFPGQPGYQINSL